MTHSFPSSGLGQGFHPESIFQAVDQFRQSFEKRVGPRVGRGEVRGAVLSLLAERPMHGYQIMGEIEERSGGSWRPSAGSVYPTLQQLADEGLIAAAEAQGRKTYTLTEAGEAVISDEQITAPWDAEPTSGRKQTGPRGALPQAGWELAQAASQVGRTGSPEQISEAVQVLTDARRRMYAILAQE